MQKPLKIIIFDGSFKTTAFINRLVTGLAQQHQVYVLGFNESLAKPIEKVTYVSLGSNQNKFKLAITSLKQAMRQGSIRGLLTILKKLVRGDKKHLQQQNLTWTLKKINPDIIHLQWPSTIPWFEHVLLEQKIPVVLSQRGYHNNVRPFVDTDNFDYLQQWYPKIAGFHSVSKAMAINGDKIWNSLNKIDRVVYTGLVIDEISFKKGFTITSPLQLLSIGRPHWKKGYDYALQACKLLKETNIAFQYTIIGGAGDEELQFLIHEFGLQSCVKLENRLPQEIVFKQMKQASLLLMPSLEEGLPNVLVEAMAVGLPVLSTDCGGVSELITHAKEGWLIPIRNPNAIVDSIIDFTKLPQEQIEAVRLAARKKAEQQHSEEMMVAGMEKLYKKVMRVQKSIRSPKANISLF